MNHLGSVYIQSDIMPGHVRASQNYSFGQKRSKERSHPLPPDLKIDVRAEWVGAKSPQLHFSNSSAAHCSRIVLYSLSHNHFSTVQTNLKDII